MSAPANDEFSRIDRIAAILEGGRAHTARDGAISIAIGDDCAVLDPRRLGEGESLAWTIDASVEGVHFRRELLSFEDVGHRATVAAASDLLAMGARPIAALAAWTIPGDAAEDDLDAIARGQADAARAIGLEIVGGNLASGPVLSLTTTAIGGARRMLTRKGARPGDRVVVAGALGEAALGLAWLLRGRGAQGGRGVERVVSAWRRPAVLRAASESIAAIATAMIDVSDGLAQDVGHLARASSVRATLDCALLHARRDDDVRLVARALDADLDDLELAGGEDYALVATIPFDAAIPDGFDVIGAIDDAPPPSASVGVEGAFVRVVEADGRDRQPPDGYRHGRRFRGWGT